MVIASAQTAFYLVVTFAFLQYSSNGETTLRGVEERDWTFYRYPHTHIVRVWPLSRTAASTLNGLYDIRCERIVRPCENARLHEVLVRDTDSGREEYKKRKKKTVNLNKKGARVGPKHVLE